MSFFFGVDTIHGVRKTTCNALIIRLKLRHRFPHLYGCGHIEGWTLPEFGRRSNGFPHLYGCGHIEGREKRHTDGNPVDQISASLWMRPH